MYEYKVVPAPVRAAKVKGLKTAADRFAHTLAEHINAQAAGGWQFQRTETLTCEVRKGLGGLKTTTQTVMVFARVMGATRPDAGAALAAAQDLEHGQMPAMEPAQADYDTAAYVDPAAQPHAPEPPAPEPPAYDAPNAYDYDAPADHADESAYQPAEPPAPARASRAARQEPLFRAAPLTRPDGARPEPVLRPPAPHSEDS